MEMACNTMRLWEISKEVCANKREIRVKDYALVLSTCPALGKKERTKEMEEVVLSWKLAAETVSRRKKTID